MLPASLLILSSAVSLSRRVVLAVDRFTAVGSARCADRTPRLQICAASFLSKAVRGRTALQSFAKRKCASRFSAQRTGNAR